MNNTTPIPHDLLGAPEVPAVAIEPAALAGDGRRPIASFWVASVSGVPDETQRDTVAVPSADRAVTGEH